MCSQWLAKSKRNIRLLDTTVNSIKERKNWSYTSPKIHLLTEKGFLQWGLFETRENRQQLEIAEAECSRELTDMQKVLGSTHTIVLALRTIVAHLIERQGKFGTSQDMQSCLVNDMEHDLDYGPDHPSTLTSMNNLADIYLSRGQLEKAEDIHCTVFNRSKKLLGDKNAYTLISANNLASLLQHRGRYKEAEQLHRYTLEKRQELLGKQHSATLTSMNNLAQTFSLLGNFSEAESLHRQCVEGCKHTLGPYHAFTLAGMNNLAEVLESQDKLEDCIVKF